jgi:hypothetical protein
VPIRALIAIAVAFALAGWTDPLGAQAQGSIYERTDSTARIDTTLQKHLPGWPRKNIDSALTANGAALNDVTIVLNFVDRPLSATGDTVATPTLSQLHWVLAALAKTVSDIEEKALPGAQAPVLPSLLTGLPSQAAIIEGLTDFVVQRAKDELVFAFVDQVRVSVHDDYILSRLLPRSRVLLDQLESGNFGPVTSVLSASFQADLKELPTNASTLSTYNADTTKIAQPARDAIHLLSVANGVYGRIQNGMSPVAALSGLGDADGEIRLLEVRLVLQHVGIAAREYSVSNSRVLLQLSNPVQRRYFLAYFVADEVRNKNLGATAHEWQPRVAGLVNHGIDAFNTLETNVLSMQTMVESLKQQVKDKQITPAQAAGALLQTCSSVVASGRELARAAKILTPAADTAIRQVITAADLAAAVLNQQYNTALATSLQLLQRVTNGMTESQVRVLTFASSVASARTADDVRAAITTAAVPVSSFRSKRNGVSGGPYFWFGLNGYLGGTRGTEHLASPNDHSSTFFGPTLPIGVEASVRIPSCMMNRLFKCSLVGSVSVLASAIDVGALTSTRLTSTTTTTTTTGTTTAGSTAAAETVTDSDVSFAQVFAPGIFVVAGITRTWPLSVGYGVQRVPKLRKINNGDAVDVTRRGVVFVAVDVPIFRF